MSVPSQATISVICQGSTDIASFEWEEATKELLVEFKGGRKWIYSDVPRNVATKFQKAKSFGKFFNKSIRGQYLGRQVIQ